MQKVFLSDVLKTIKKAYIWNDEISQQILERAMMQLPPADDAAGWISCSERLPENEKAVLVYEADNENSFLAIYEDGRWKSFDPTYTETYFDETVYWHIVAWMPLPYPYEED